MVAQSCTEVLHYRPGEPRTPAVAIALSGFGGLITAAGTPLSTTHPPTTTLLINTSSLV